MTSVEHEARALLWEAFPQPSSEAHKSWDNVLDRAGVERVALYDAVQGSDGLWRRVGGGLQPRRVPRIRPDRWGCEC
jgi:hypothetical protein